MSVPLTVTEQPPTYKLIEHGTTALETFLAILPSFAIVTISSLLSSFTPNCSSHKRFLLEFVLIAPTIVLSFTLLVPKLLLVNAILFGIGAVLYVLLLRFKKLSNMQKQKLLVSRGQKPFLTNVRCTIFFLTVVAILAVDFTRVFPDRFRKTLMYGFSLMDVGVGLFVFANGIVAPEIGGHKGSIIKVLKSVAPLIVIGGARFVALKQINYYYSSFEYGVHWNFFITLALVRLFSALFLKVVKVQYAVFAGTFLLFVHAIALQLGLAEFTLSTYPRNNFFTANREGFVSLIGYLGLYFLSVSFGSFIGVKLNVPFGAKQLVKLFASTAICAWTSMILYKHFKVSRRLANSGYCVWVMCIGVTGTTYFYLSELLLRFLYGQNRKLNQVYVPVMFEAINYNPLVFFLLGNLLTGFVNIVFEPYKFQALLSCITLVFYLFINCIVCYILYRRGIKIRL